MAKGFLHYAKCSLVLLTLLFSIRELRANTFMELESTYEGDGWFQYKLRLPVDPFWEVAYIHYLSFQFLQATGEKVVPPSWSGDAYALGPNDSQARPTEYIFRFRSSYRHFKLHPIGFSTRLYLVPQVWNFTEVDGHTIYAQSIFGFTNHECLVPCPPDEADGSAPLHVMRFITVPDVKILQLLTDSNGVSGLKYYLPYDASFVVEGSQNLTNWNPVAYGSAEAGTNQFNSASLITSGPYYRIQITAVNGHNLSSAQPTNTGGLTGKLANDVKLLATATGKVITFPSIASKIYQIDFTSAQGAVLKSFTHQAQSDISTFPVPTELQAGPIFVAVRPLPSAAQ